MSFNDDQIWYDKEDTDTVTITGMFKYETDKAILMVVDNKDCWIPKSAIHNKQSCADYKYFSLIQLEVDEWIALERGLI